MTIYDNDTKKYYDTGEIVHDTTNCNVDNVNHPKHYTFGKYEVIDIIKDQLSEDQFIGYCLGNAVKYISRCQHKGKMTEDIRKAIWYLNAIVEN